MSANEKIRQDVLTIWNTLFTGQATRFLMMTTLIEVKGWRQSLRLLEAEPAAVGGRAYGCWRFKVRGWRQALRGLRLEVGGKRFAV